MTRPIIQPAPFNVVCAPSCSRPQIPPAALSSDLLQVKRLMGDSGVAGFTEIARPWSKTLVRKVFGANRVGLSVSDCPIVWTDDFKRIDGGVEVGSKGIPVIAPERHSSWVILERADGLKVGVISTHMIPGAWAAHPSRAQRLVRPALRHRWNHHERVLRDRIAKLAARCDVVVMVGDINHPGLKTWPGLVRVSTRGLVYIGVSTGATHTAPVAHKQRADHAAQSTTVTKEKS